MSKKIAEEYLTKLNELNKEYGMVIKYDINTGSYYLEDQIEFDYDFIECEINPTTDRTEFRFVTN